MSATNVTPLRCGCSSCGSVPVSWLAVLPRCSLWGLRSGLRRTGFN